MNILFLSCGHFHRIGEWYGCLFGRHELFTSESFQAPETYSKVDVVILSNVKYRHQHARDYPAWTLDDVLLLPVVNPHSRRRLLTQAVNEGLGVFDHYLKDIARPQIISAMYHPVDPAVDAMTQVNYFVQERLGGYRHRCVTILKGKGGAGEGRVGADLRFADVNADSQPRCLDQKWVVSCEA